MNSRIALIILTSSIALLNCQKLSEKENENRLDKCGSFVQSKIYEGKEVNHRLSPWTVHMSSSQTCTGTIISPRHVLTATHCVAHMTKDMTGFTHIIANNKTIKKEDCNGDDYILDLKPGDIPFNFLSGDTIEYVTTPQNQTKVRGGISVGKAKKFFMIGACRKFESSPVLVDITVVELEKEINIGVDLKMACVSDSLSHVMFHSTLDFYGYGTNPINASSNVHRYQQNGSYKVKMLYEQIQVLSAAFSYRSKKPKTGARSDEELVVTRAMNETTVACPGDSGGGVTRSIQGRETVVLVLSQTSCEGRLRTHDAMEFWTAVASQSDAICKYSGICSKTSTTVYNFASIFAFVVLIF